MHMDNIVRGSTCVSLGLLLQTACHIAACNHIVHTPLPHFLEGQTSQARVLMSTSTSVSGGADIFCDTSVCHVNI